MPNQELSRIQEIRNRTAVVLVGLLSATALNACGDNDLVSNNRGNETQTELTTSDQATVDSLTTGELSEAEAISDADLKLYDAVVTNCGGKLRNEAQPDKFFETWIDYANQNPELAPQQMALFDTLLGKEAVNSLLTNGYLNPDTSADVTIAGDERANRLAHINARFELTKGLTLANTTCIDKNGNVIVRRADGKPTIHLAEGQFGQGVAVDNDGLADFLPKARKMSDGGIAFELLPLGTVDILVNGVLLKKNLTGILMKADACANITPRLIPKTPVSAPPKTHIPGTPQPTTPGTPQPTTPLPTKSPKQLDGTMPHPQPGGGGSQETGGGAADDSTQNGYGTGDVPTYTVPRTPEPTPTTAPDNVEVGPPRQEAPPQTIATTVPAAQSPPPALGN